MEPRKRESVLKERKIVKWKENKTADEKETSPGVRIIFIVASRSMYSHVYLLFFFFPFFFFSVTPLPESNNLEVRYNSDLSVFD